MPDFIPGGIVIKCPVLMQEDWDNYARCGGWNGQKLVLDEKGHAILDEDHNPIYQPYTAQEFIADRFWDFAVSGGYNTCFMLEAEQGSVNYNAIEKVAGFKAYTTSEWREDV